VKAASAAADASGRRFKTMRISMVPGAPSLTVSGLGDGGSVRRFVSSISNSTGSEPPDGGKEIGALSSMMVVLALRNGAPAHRSYV